MGPGRYFKRFVMRVASFSQSMSPWRATATPKVPEIPKCGHCVNLCGHIKSDLLDPVCIANRSYVLQIQKNA